MRKWIFVLDLLAFFAGAGHAAELWTMATDGDVWDLAATDDLDGDGKNDILAGAADNALRAISGADGRVLWSQPAGGDVWCAASFPDLDGDGKREAVAGTGGNEVLLVSATGALIWIFAAGGDVWSVAEAGDSNGDGKPELACGAGDNLVYLLDLKGKAKRWSVDLGGDVWSVAGGKDLNGDGTPDVAAGTGANTVVALDGKTGAEIWSYTTTGDAWQVILTGDVDGDAVADVIAGTAGNRVICLSGKPSTGGGPGGPGGTKILWQSMAGSDIHVVVEAPDSDGDGSPEILAGGSDNTLRLLSGKTGDERWATLLAGSIEDAIVAADLDADGKPDLIASTDGSTVEALAAKDGGSLWTYQTEIDATVWSLAPLSDVDGDGLADLAAGTALNEVVGIPAAARPQPPDPVNDLACVAAQTPEGPGALLTWTDPLLVETVKVYEVVAGTPTLLAEVAAGVGKALVPAAGTESLRDYSASAVNGGGESVPESCTVTMTPPPVTNLLCAADGAGAALVSWTLPDPGLRALDGVRLVLDGAAAVLLPPTATSHDIGKVAVGLHTVVVTTMWGPWDSPTFTCIFEAIPTASLLYIRGDANTDGRLDISDAISILLYLFAGQNLTCMASVDANGDERIDISDGIYELSHLFSGGPAPPAPYPECGSAGTLDCESDKACQ